jgi:hypothetical protein
MGAAGEAVGPFASHGLVEALDLAVGARPVGLGCEVADAVTGELRLRRQRADQDPGHYGWRFAGKNTISRHTLSYLDAAGIYQDGNKTSDVYQLHTAQCWADHEGEPLHVRAAARPAVSRDFAETVSGC